MADPGNLHTRKWVCLSPELQAILVWVNSLSDTLSLHQLAGVLEVSSNLGSGCLAVRFIETIPLPLSACVSVGLPTTLYAYYSYYPCPIPRINLCPSLHYYPLLSLP